jgi:hypothetical protein
MTRDGSDNFDAGLSGGVLRIGTIRAPWTSAAEARASARFKVRKVEAVENSSRTRLSR